MSESGIFPVSIPRLSMHTGPGASVKPVHKKKKKYRTQQGAVSVRSLHLFWISLQAGSLLRHTRKRRKAKQSGGKESGEEASRK